MLLYSRRRPMKALFLFLVSCSTAQCQQAQERFLAEVPYGMKFLPKDFLQRPVVVLGSNSFDFRLKKADYSIHFLPGNTQHLKAYGYQTAETINQLSGPAIAANLSVIRRNTYKPRREGSFTTRFGHAFLGGITSLGDYNAAANYYRLTKPPNMWNPREMYHYERNRDPLQWLVRQLLNSWKQTLVREFRPHIKIRILKK